MKKLILLLAFGGLGSFSTLTAQTMEGPCNPSCEKEKYYAMSQTSTGELCCSLTDNPLNSCTGESCT